LSDACASHSSPSGTSSSWKRARYMSPEEAAGQHRQQGKHKGQKWAVI
jgi:hypothetical protein